MAAPAASCGAPVALKIVVTPTNAPSTEARSENIQKNLATVLGDRVDWAAGTESKWPTGDRAIVEAAVSMGWPTRPGIRSRPQCSQTTAASWISSAQKRHFLTVVFQLADGWTGGWQRVWF